MAHSSPRLASATRVALRLLILLSALAAGCATTPEARPQPSSTQPEHAQPEPTPARPEPVTKADQAPTGSTAQPDAQPSARPNAQPAPQLVDQARPDGEAAKQERSPKAPEPYQGPMLRLPAGQVTSLSFGKKGELLVGFRDSAVVVAQPDRKKAKLLRAYAQPHPVLDVSPDGKLAVIQTQRGKVTRTRDGQTMLELHHMERIEGARFSPDGELLLISDDRGKLHIWRKAQELDTIIERDSRLQYYVARQSPSMSASLAEIAGPLHTQDARVLFVRRSGQVVLWDVDKPTSALTIMRHEVPVRSLVALGDHVLVTWNDQLRVASIQARRVVDWSRAHRAELIAAHPKDPERFAQLVDQELSMRQLKDGSASWQVTLASAGEACGLAISQDLQQIAACKGDVITLHEAKSGKQLRQLERIKDKLVWR